MSLDAGAEHKELSVMNNRELVELAARSKNLTPLEVELMLRLESFIEIFGDYLTEV